MQKGFSTFAHSLHSLARPWAIPPLASLPLLVPTLPSQGNRVLLIPSSLPSLCPRLFSEPLREPRQDRSCTAVGCGVADPYRNELRPALTMLVMVSTST